MNKNYSISLIRLISLLMIISCHILQGLNIELAFWINVGVQIFFFMSGFLYGLKDNENLSIIKWYKKQFTKILLPLFILQIIILIIDHFLFNITYSKYQIIANMIGLGGFYGPFPILSHTWFVSYILICYLITPILYNIGFHSMKPYKAFKLLFIIALILIAFQYFKVTYINAAWLYNYVLGFFFADYFIKQKRNYKSFTSFIISLTILTLIPRLYIQYGNINLPNFIIDNQTYLYNWNHILIGTSLFIIMYSLFNKIKIPKLKILELSDKYSYFIYLTHQIFILNYLSILFFTKSLILNILLILFISILSGIILYLLTSLIKKLTSRYKQVI